MAILDDNHGNLVAPILSLGSRKVTFDKVKTGTEVAVQLAIVVATADGDYVVSDILETSVNQSLTEPSFGGRWHQLVGELVGGARDRMTSRTTSVRLRLGISTTPNRSPAA